MIYLIGGTPRCGKTTIAKKLSKELRVPWISADTIESEVLAHTSTKKIAKLFPKNVIRKETGQSNDEMYEKYSAKVIMNAYIKQSEAIWETINTIVNQRIKQGQDYIIEGHQIHPKLISELTKKHKKDIRALILTRSDIKKIVDGCLNNKAENDWFIQKTKKKETFFKIARMLSEYSDFLEKEAKKYKIKTINVDINFRNQLNMAAKYIKD